MAVEANLGSNSTEIVIGVIILITNAIKIVEELIIFIGYKAFKLKVFKIIITIIIIIRSIYSPMRCPYRSIQTACHYKENPPYYYYY